ncbi:hypothetical protein MMC25_006042 [Agyrium rufum]|nr:hypothetical protein [Agyrium rufum]
MWKRLNNRSSERLAGFSTTETAVEGHGMDQPDKTATGNLSLTTRPVLGRKDTDVLKELPNIPSSSLHVPQRTNHHPSKSNVSSVYSQPSPDLRYNAPRLHMPRSSSIYPDDVSPPDTPRSHEGAQSFQSSPDVSPITEQAPFPPSLFEPKRKMTPSQIPIPRPTPAPKSDSSPQNWRDTLRKVTDPDRAPKKGTKWDVYSGEPTTKETGKSAQVIPGSPDLNSFGSGSDSEKRFGHTVQITGGKAQQQQKTLLAERLKKVGKKEREEWKGQSGRSATIRPLVDAPPSATTKQSTFKSFISPKHQDKPSEPRQVQPTASKPNASMHKPIITKQPEGPREQAQQAQPPRISSLRPANSDEEIKPIVPLKIRRESPVTSTFPNETQNSPTIDANQKSPTPSPTEDTRSPLARHPHVSTDMPPMPTRGNHFLDMTPVASPDGKLWSDPRKIGSGPTLHDLDFANEPPSRFSMSTFATTQQSSPPATPKLSIEIPPSSTPPPREPTPPSPVLGRRRPVPPRDSFRNNTQRKPTPSESVDSASKPLPSSPGPGENGNASPIEVVDRVVLLTKKVEALNRRKGELMSMITELTQVTKPSTLKTDMASRLEIKKTVDRLEGEAAGVAKEIHDTGLKLHRAMRKRDEKLMYEPTALWVRRVTE